MWQPIDELEEGKQEITLHNNCTIVHKSINTEIFKVTSYFTSAGEILEVD